MIKSSDQEIASRKPTGEQRRPGRRNVAGDRMRGAIIDAALRTLIAEGYAGTSVRSIASIGGFSPALVFYHFGSVDALLLAALDRVSTDRLARYQARLADVSTLQSLGTAMEELYAEDLELGRLTAVQEVVGAMAFDPELGPEILARMQPWMTFAEQLATRLITGSPLAGLIDPGVIGSAVIALYLGLEIVARMRGGDTSGSSALVAALGQTAPWIDRLLGRSGATRRRPATRVAVE
jgi:AcrR family transcriptional regulator